MSSRHQHTRTGTFAISGDVDAAIAALDARLKKLEAPVPSPYTLDLTFATMPSQFVPQYTGVNDWGDRLDTNMDAASTRAQSSIAGGILTLACERKANPSGRSHVGACWSTYGTFAQKYGTFEARLRYDEAERTWPSLFLFEKGKKGPYPEVDWIEAYGSPLRLGPGKTEHVVYAATGGPSRYVVMPLAPGWHEYKLIWTPTSLRFYIDGVESSTSYIDGPSGATVGPLPLAYVPQVEMYPVIAWGVDPVNATGPAPDRVTLDIDFLRVTV